MLFLKVFSVFVLPLAKSKRYRECTFDASSIREWPRSTKHVFVNYCSRHNIPADCAGELFFFRRMYNDGIRADDPFRWLHDGNRRSSAQRAVGIGDVRCPRLLRPEGRNRWGKTVDHMKTGNRGSVHLEEVRLWQEFVFRTRPASSRLVGTSDPPLRGLPTRRRSLHPSSRNRYRDGAAG